MSAAAVWLLLACTHDPSCDVSPASAPDPDDHRVTQQAALAELDAVLAAIDEPATRGTSPRTVRSVATVKGSDFGRAATRTGEGTAVEELVYIANFDDGRGYAILGADDRLPSVLAVTECGSLTAAELVGAGRNTPEPDESETPVVIPELAAYVTRMATYGFETGIDGPYVPPPVFTTYATYGPWTENTRLGPMIPFKWNQGDPYDYYSPYVVRNGETVKGYVGCVAVAVGTIVAMNARDGKYPAYALRGGPFDVEWSTVFKAIDLLKKDRYFIPGNYSEESLAVANLLRTIGIKLGMDYKPDGSGASIDDAVAFLKNYAGYKSVSKTGYSKEAILKMLQTKLPVYIRGCYSPNGKRQSGHAWVIDGYLCQQRCMYVYSIQTDALLRTELEYRELFHCNYGWGGTNDGYYFSGVFNIKSGPVLLEPLVGDTGDIRNNDDHDLYNLDSYLEIITYSRF